MARRRTYLVDLRVGLPARVRGRRKAGYLRHKVLSEGGTRRAAENRAVKAIRRLFLRGSPIRVMSSAPFNTEFWRYEVPKGRRRRR